VNGVRILLIGESSGMRRIIEKICVDHSNMTLLYECDHKEILDAEDFVATIAVVAIIKSNDVNVVLLDLDDRSVVAMDSALTLNMFATDVAHKLLELFPQLTVVSLSSRGRKMNIFTEFHLNDVGVNQLMNAINLVSRGRNVCA